MIHPAFFVEICEEYKLVLSYKDDSEILTNPKNGATIALSEDNYTTVEGSDLGSQYTEYTVYFSTQHRHFSSLDSAEEYIRMILSDEVLPIEFFDSNRPSFGGEIGKADLIGLSIESLAQKFGHSDCLTDFEFEVHSWSGKHDITRSKVSELPLCRKTTSHSMSLQSEPFEMIKSGQKTIELRLYDEKRQRVKPGDEIVFTNVETRETIKTTVLKLHLFDSFAALYKSLPLLKCGYTEETVSKAAPSDMEQYYSAEEQKRYGVVGIELSLLNES